MTTFGNSGHCYWDNFYLIITTSSPSGTSEPTNTIVMIHDAFQPLSYWQGFMPYPKWDGVILDTHIYEMFSVQVSISYAGWYCEVTVYQGNKMSDQEHIQSACSHASDLTSAPLWVVVGEWTPAANDCAKLHASTAVMVWQAKDPHSLRAIRISWGSIGKHRWLLLRRDKDGCNGLGRRNKLTSGVTRQA